MKACLFTLLIALVAPVALAKTCNDDYCTSDFEDCCTALWETQSCSHDYEAENDRQYFGDSDCGIWDQYTCCEKDHTTTIIVVIVLVLGVGLAIWACTKCDCCKNNGGVQPVTQTIVVQAGGGGQAMPVAQQVVGGPQQQAAAVAVPVQQQIKVVVPPGVAPGQTFNVCANGRNIPVTVPPGCAPGTTLMINA